MNQSTDTPRPTEYDIVPTREGYDLWSEIYDCEDNPLILLEEPRVSELLGEVRGLRVADIGCGTGRHALRLARAGAIVSALDFSEGMLVKARAKPDAAQVRWISHDLTQPLPLDAAAFDRVICCLVLDHIARLPPFFAELRRLAKPGGAIIISVMHPAMMLRGIQARFVDPKSSREVRPASSPNQISDYVRAALGSGLQIEHISEHAIDETIAARSPRARKYLDWPMLLMMRLRPEGLRLGP